MNHLYLHGFASGPSSRKAVAVREILQKHGIDLDVPDLNLPSFEHLTITAMVEEAERRLKPDSVVWGSSLGGYLATLLANRHPDKVKKLIVFAPAGEFPRAFPERGDSGKAAWARGGTVPVFHHARRQTLPLAGDLAADCERWPIRLRVPCPALVVAARHDDVIPLPTIESWAAEQPQATLHVVDDAHDMNQVIPQLLQLASDFLGLSR
ncbi:MAG: alpha/beta fold hydrolase [Deltaproteobacteria bacterium]|nr:alpha/beta fold hydrolase [Deltaproteobacteria bacterium]